MTGGPTRGHSSLVVAYRRARPARRSHWSGAGTGPPEQERGFSPRARAPPVRSAGPDTFILRQSAPPPDNSLPPTTATGAVVATNSKGQPVLFQNGKLF